MDPSKSTQVLDLPALFERIGPDDELAKELASVFLDDSPVLMDAIERAAVDGDAVALERAAHTLKGSALNFGAQRVSGICLELEQRARAGQVDGAPVISQLGLELRRLNDELRRFVAEPES